ncbi:MAG: glycosyltransferase family 39 protein [Thermoleophilia bacterium]|nr:glycosyltransferase family 39 protein [Thermoleophilia bacterium]
MGPPPPVRPVLGDGGIFLYRIAARVTGAHGSLVALTLYLVWPYGVWHSRLFMPDATMVAVLLAAALTVIRYWERRTFRRLWLAGGVSSVAVAIKPGVALLFLVALFLALAFAHRRLRSTLTSGAFLLFTALSLATSLAYYAYGAWVTDFISSGASTRRVTPDLLITSGFWSGWWRMVSYLLPFPQPQPWLALLPIVAGLAGLVVARPGTPRAIVVGLATGYVAFALAFANYTSTHPYYSLALIPVLSLSVGALAGALVERLRPGRRWVLPALAALLVVVAGVASYKSAAVLRGPEPTARIADYRRIGELTDHTTRALVVDEELATPAMYWGWIVGRNWELDYNETLPPWLRRADFDYLVVVGLDQLERYPGLRLFAQGHPVVGAGDDYAVFDLRHPTRSGARSASA